LARKRRIESAFEQAERNLQIARQELINRGFDDRLADEMLPQLPDIDFRGNLPLTSSTGARSVFASKKDMDTVQRYLDRINTDIVSAMEGGNIADALMLTFVSDEEGETQSRFMQREEGYSFRREQSRRLAALKEQGIEMVQTPVYRINSETGELEQVWTESRHKLMQWVPATPAAERKLNAVTRQQTNLRPLNPETPDDAVVDMWGDIVPATRTQFKQSSQQIARSLQQDYLDALKVEGYFANMKGILDAVLPSGMSDTLDPVFEQIMRESPERMFEIYQAMAGKGKYSDLDDATEFIVDLDWIYSDLGTNTSGKMYALFNVMQSRVLPLLSEYIDMPVMGSADEFEEMFAADIPALAEGDNIFAHYQALRQEGKVTGIPFSQLRDYRGVVVDIDDSVKQALTGKTKSIPLARNKFYETFFRRKG